MIALANQVNLANQVKPSTFSLCSNPVDEKKGPVNKEKEKLTYTIGEVFNASLNDKIKEWVRVLGYTASYVGHFNPDAPEAVSAFGSRMGEFKNFLSIRELYRKTQQVNASFFLNEPVEKSVISVFAASTNLMSSVVDSLSFASRYVYINASTLKLIGKNTDLAKFACALLSGRQHAEELHNAVTDEKSTLELKIASLLKLSVDISYIALGIISIGFSAPPAIAITTCSAAAAVLCLISYFHEKIYDPYHKNSDVNWDAFKHRVRFSD